MYHQRLRVCYFGTYRANYSRNEIMIEGLRRNGIEVIECHEPLWHGFEDRVQIASGGWMSPAFWRRLIRTYSRLLTRYWQVRGMYDVLVVGYPGQLDVLLARLLSIVHRKPLVWDIFMSIYLIALERKLDTRNRFTIAAIRRLEQLSCHVVDLPILDTAAYAAWFQATHAIPAERFRLVPTGADDRFFHQLPPPDMPSCSTTHTTTETFRIVYYGTFIPNHGVTYIVEAARLLADDPRILFTFIGNGPEKEPAVQLAAHYGLTNITYINWLSKDELVAHVQQAHVCLGAFGTTPQSVMTVQNKIYEALAMARPIITGDSPAVREVLTHHVHIYLCERANPHAIATAIRTLCNDASLRERLAREGYAIFSEQFAIAHIGAYFAKHLYELHRRAIRSS